ncbi:TetR/AcrR family transcriptional regulator [Kurthia sibirica]|uniref:TetR/AcrR family transcriptional regulator n=1 Tax=Kurthia sibirica TaxID=202750 RepID=UPI0011730128|nr:TetR/AcrR family transcriptional regulator [Kurthia sibirica]GEK34254.1 TetR family transcriptional regulator [Kurthia sibirica]
MVQTDPRQIKTREKLHRAALQLFSEMKGDPSIKEVCETAQITRPTFYNHHSSVEDLKESMMLGMLAQMKDSLSIKDQAKIEFLVPDEMPRIFEKLFQHFEKNLYFYKTFLVERKEPTISDGVLEVLTDYISSGMALVQPEKDYIAPEQLIINYVAGAYYQTIIWWIQDNKPLPAIEVYSNMISLSLHGPYSNLLEQFSTK